MSSTTSRIVGSFIRRMRHVSQMDKNMETRWEKDAPTGWSRERMGPRGATKALHKVYAKYQHSHEGGHKTYNQ